MCWVAPDVRAQELRVEYQWELEQVQNDDNNSYRSPRGVEVESGIDEASDRSRVYDDDSAAAENENTKTKLEDVESTPD